MKPKMEIQGHLATIILQRPAVANKLAPEDLDTLVSYMEEVNQSPDVRVVVLRGEGKYFCSGYDISEIGETQEQRTGFDEMVDAIERCRAVTIAAIHGGVYGGATDMALACDFRIGSTLTEMFMPAARLGLHFYATGMERYVSRLGVDTAKRLFLTCERLNAEEMKACGFLTQLVTPEAFESAVEQLAKTLSAMAPIPLFGMKKHLNLIARGSHDIAVITQEVQRSLASEDLREGGRAWQEKRLPSFQGR